MEIDRVRGGCGEPMRIEHTIDEEWYWNVDDQDYRILIIHHDDCVACMMGVPIEEE